VIGSAPRTLWATALAVALLLLAPQARAEPKFPALTGRVVDDAHILSADAQQQLSSQLETLEGKTGRQVVVVTVPSLQDYPIEDFGYQLGRAWGIGQKGQDNGALFIVAPNERKVRVEVGYGLEPVLTDALSSVILQRSVLPKFRSGDMQGGVIAGTEAIVRQLSLPDDQAKANVAQAKQRPMRRGAVSAAPIFAIIILFWVLTSLLGALGGRRRAGAGSAWWLLPLLLSGSSRRDDWRGGGGWGGGSWGGGSGGGFSGGGGSFGGGGSSGSW
jgi:uncharacterized protein